MAFLTAAFIAAMIGTATAAMTSDHCGGWGEWSVPINTVLLIVLALIQLRTRRRVVEQLAEVQEVTDTVKLRDPDQGGKRNLRTARSCDCGLDPGVRRDRGDD